MSPFTQEHPRVRQSRFIEIRDSFELNILLQRQSSPGTPALYQRILDQTFWAPENDLIRWRQTRTSTQFL